jgi:large subunit ribosomal protein L31
MKKDIHPNYVEATVHCSCGNTFTTRSTKPELRIELCSQCHPFYTGKQKLVDSGGRVERFNRRFDKKAEPSIAEPAKAAAVKAEPAKAAAVKAAVADAAPTEAEAVKA